MPAVKVAEFRGAVRCRSEPGAPLGLTLSGCTPDHPREELELAFAGAAPADLPERLDDALIERAGPQQYRIASGHRTWLVQARSVHLHRDVAEAFYRAIPPRRAPLARRLLFNVLPGIARSRAGLALLRALGAR